MKFSIKIIIAVAFTASIGSTYAMRRLATSMLPKIQQSFVRTRSALNQHMPKLVRRLRPNTTQSRTFSTAKMKPRVAFQHSQRTFSPIARHTAKLLLGTGVAAQTATENSEKAEASAEQTEQTEEIHLTMEHIEKYPALKEDFIQAAVQNIRARDAATISAIIFLVRTWPDAAQTLAEKALEFSDVHSLIIKDLDTCIPGFAEQYTMTHAIELAARNGVRMTQSNGKLIAQPIAESSALDVVAQYVLVNGAIDFGTKTLWHGVRPDHALESLPRALAISGASTFLSNAAIDLANDVTGGNLPCLSYDPKGSNKCYYFARMFVFPSLVNAHIVSPLLTPSIESRSNPRIPFDK